jgi:hypothetical protein
MSLAEVINNLYSMIQEFNPQITSILLQPEHYEEALKMILKYTVLYLVDEFLMFGKDS